MVIPVDHEVNKTQEVTKKDGPQLDEVGKFMADWGAKSKNHDRDDDGEYGITECLQAI